MLIRFLSFFMISIVYSSMLEWWIHKYLMHQPKLFYHAFDRHQLQHHSARKSMKRFFLRAPEVAEYKFYESSFMPMLFLLHMPLFIALGWLFRWPSGVGFAIGGGGYLMLYELLHWAMHVPRPHWINGTRYFRYITELHRVHHYRAWQNYNVVLPIADVLLGTLNHDWLPPEPAVNVSPEDERAAKRPVREPLAPV